jgi:hypothetical protein
MMISKIGSRPTRRACRRLAATSCWSWPTATFFELRTAPELESERQQLDQWLAAGPDKTLALVA